MKHRYLLLTAALLLSIALTGLRAQTKLYIYDNSGMSFSHVLSDIRKLTFSAVSLRVFEYNGNYGDYSLANTHYLSFTEMPDALPDELTESESTSLYPNPVTNELTISFTLAGAMNVHVDIMDMQGRILIHQTVEGNGGTNLSVMKVTELSGGMYLCRVQSRNSLECIKFLKN
jgi:hypothetical protein